MLDILVMITFVFWIVWASYGIVIIGFDMPNRLKRLIQKNKLSKEDSIENTIIRTNPNLEKYYQAIEDNDEEAAYDALIANAESCRCRNSYCLTEVFCPECPLEKGGIYVQSSMNGMK